MQQECTLLSKGACEFVAVTVQDFVMRPLVFEGIHCNSVVSIDELDLHAAVGVVPAGKAAAHENIICRGPWCPKHASGAGPCEVKALASCSKQADMAHSHAGQARKDLYKHKAAQCSSDFRKADWPVQPSAQK